MNGNDARLQRHIAGLSDDQLMNALNNLQTVLELEEKWAAKKPRGSCWEANEAWWIIDRIRAEFNEYQQEAIERELLIY